MAAITEDTVSGETDRTFYYRFNRFLERHLPEGLYRRSLIIVIAPMVLLQSIMAGIFMERHWDNVTKALSRSVAREIAFVIDVYDTMPKTAESLQKLEAMANEKLAIGLKIDATGGTLPPPAPKPFFSLLDRKLSQYVSRYAGKPFWLDTIGQSGYVDLRVQADEGVIFRFLTRHDRAAASNTHIFLLWMVGSSLVLLFVAIVFLRNQIRPILQLAEAAQSFGMGREVDDFQPRGASEIRAAAEAFINMKRRIERHVEQRTAMLAGVSHDLRTILTRFKLELAFLPDDPKVRALKEDVDEMQRMLEAYIAFVRGDGGETVSDTDIGGLLEAICDSLARGGCEVSMRYGPNVTAPVKPIAFKRCITNLAANATRFADVVELAVRNDGRYLHVTVDDNGPGIPVQKRKEVFRPFVRLDHARNQDEIGTGLGLAIARDIAQSHGGDITLGDSKLGGLRVNVRLPV